MLNMSPYKINTALTTSTNVQEKELLHLLANGRMNKFIYHDEQGKNIDIDAVQNLALQKYQNSQPFEIYATRDKV